MKGYLFTANFPRRTHSFGNDSPASVFPCVTVIESC